MGRMNFTTFSRLAWSMAIGIAVLVLTSCDNPLQAVLADQVNYYRAPSHTLTVINANGVVLNQSGALSIKEGYPITLTATPGQGYTFQAWQQTAGSGTVTFSAASSSTTEVTLTGGDASIVPVVAGAFALTGSSPTGSGVDTLSTIRATFNRAPDPASPASTLVVRKTSNQSAVSGSLTVSGNALVFTPSSPLEASTQYTATVTSSAADTQGHSLGTEHSWDFTTGVGLSVSSRSPTGSAAGINASIQVTLSRTINSATVPGSLSLKRTDNNSPVTGTLAASGATLTFTPSANLSALTGYTATLRGTLGDTFGNTLGSDQSWDFTTGDGSAPYNTSVSINSDAAWTNSTTVSLALAAQDDGTSIQMRISNSAVYQDAGWVAFAATSPWTLDAAEGSKSVYVWFKDQSGNVSTVCSDTIGLDTTAPTGSISFGTTYTTGNSAAITVSASDAASGLGQMRFSSSSVYADNGWETQGASKNWTLNTVDGSQTVWVWFKDQAGNVSSGSSASITRDTTPPTVLGTVVGSGATNPSPATTSYIDITLPPDVNTSALTAFVSNASTPNATFKLWQTNNVYYTFPGSLAISTDGSGNKVVRYSFTNILSFSTQYTLQILGGANGAKDLAGNALASTVTVNFTTKARTLALSTLQGSVSAPVDVYPYYFRDMIFSPDGTRIYGITYPRSGVTDGRVFSINLQNAPALQDSDLDNQNDTLGTPNSIAASGDRIYVSTSYPRLMVHKAAQLDQYIQSSQNFNGQLVAIATNGIVQADSSSFMGFWAPAAAATSVSSGSLFDSSSTNYYSSGLGQGYDLGAMATYGDLLFVGTSFIDMTTTSYIDAISLDYFAGGPGASTFVDQYVLQNSAGSPIDTQITSMAVDTDSALLYIGTTAGSTGKGLAVYGGVEDAAYADGLYWLENWSLAAVSCMSMGTASTASKTRLNYESLLALSHGSAGNTGGTSGTKGFSLLNINAKDGTRSVLSYSGAMTSNGKYAYRILIQNIDGFTYNVYLLRGTSPTTMDTLEVYRLTVN